MDEIACYAKLLKVYNKLSFHPDFRLETEYVGKVMVEMEESYNDRTDGDLACEAMQTFARRD